MSQPARFAVLVLLLIATHTELHRASAGEPKGPLIGFAAPREWSDTSGKFKIRAKLKIATEEEVQLLKDDSKIVKVPFAKLSEPDRAFVQSFLKAEEALMAASGSPDEDAENPFAGGEPSTGSTKAPAPGRDRNRGDSLNDSASRGELEKRVANVKGMKQLTITPSKEFWSAPPLRGFPDVAFDDLTLQAPIPKPFFAGMRVLAAGKSGNLVVNTYQQGNSAAENYSKFLLVNAASGDSSDVLELPEPWKLMALSLDGSRAAAVRIEGFDKGNDVALFHVTPNGLTPEFQFTAGGGSWDELHYVAFLPGNQLVTISQKSNLTFWDLDAERGPKAVRRGSTGGSLTAELSPAGELLAMINGSSVAFIETSGGKMVGCIRRDQTISRIAFSSDGQSLAVFQPFQITVYETQSGQEKTKFAVSEGNPQSEVFWVGRHLLVGPIVYDVERGVPLWTYNSNPSARTALGAYLISAFGGDKESTATLFRVPHEEAIRAGSDVDPKAIYAIVPGDAVSVKYELSNVAANVQQEIRKAVEAKVSELGWQLSNSAPNTITIKVEQGKPGEAEYFTYNGFGPAPIFAPPGFGRTSGPGIKVQFTPWDHSVTILASGKPVFQAQYQRGAPHNLETKDGESTQQAVNRFCQPWADYFKGAAIPPHLLKAEYQGGLGKSSIDASGLH